MTTETRQIYTLDEFLALPDNGNRFELVEGELIEMAGANEEHSRVAARLTVYLGNFVLQNKLGEVYNSDARYATVPGSDTVRLPDVSFVAADRVTRKAAVMHFGPDLAVEVISESNSFSEIENKAREYRRAGSRLVWVIEPEAKLVHIYRAGSTQRETLDDTAELDGETVIPGFKLKISTLFD